MNKENIFRIIKIGGFFIFLTIAMSSFFSIFSFWDADGIYSMRKFYKLPKNTVDVLILGSSHAYESINPAILFSEYGITSFLLTGSSQPMWNTYFYLCEAIRTQKPKVVVLEAFGVVFNEEYGNVPCIGKNTYGMKPTMRYINALKASAPKDEFWDYFFRFPMYHNRYVSLENKDFLDNMGDNMYTDWKGFWNNTDHIPFEQPNVDGITNRSPMTQKTESYYRAIIELCCKKNIPLEIVVAPYVISPKKQEIFNSAYDIASEYNVSFTNLNNHYDDIGFDFGLHMADEEHVNSEGSLIISRYIGSKLKGKYTISDNRNNPLYATWQRNADYYWQVIYNQVLGELLIGNDTLFEYIVDNQYYLPLISDSQKTQNKYNLDNSQANFSIRIRDTKLSGINLNSVLSKDRFKQLGSVMISLDNENNILVNGIKIAVEEGYINLLIYDPVTDRIVTNALLQ